MKLAWLLWIASILPQPVGDQTCLATTIYLEARGQPTLGQFAVAEVALRRRERGTWGKTVCDVVNAPHQFATTTMPPSFHIDNLHAWEKAWKIAGESMAIWRLPPSKRILVVPRADHFATIDCNPWWAGSAPHRRIGKQLFYAVN